MFISNALTRTLLVSAFFLLTSSATAATLYGKVDAVDEGDVLTVTNLNRSIKIRLRGIDAPEKDQPLAEVSRQHLADLVLNKFVVVHYTGLGNHNYILGRVVLGEIDICAQMLRDGAAWYDASDAEGLSHADRETYVATEQAARSERRGIWSEPSPVAPWDYRRALTEKRLPATEKTTPAESGTKTSSTPRTGLDGFSKTSPASSSSWKTLSPSDFNFSVLVPGNAQEQGIVIPVRAGANQGNLDFNVSEGSAENSAYMVIWAKGPMESSSTSEILNQIANDVGRLLDLRLKRMGRDDSFELTFKRDLTAGSAKGKQFKMSVPGLEGVLQVFTTTSKRERLVYVLCVMNASEHQQPVKDFFSSLNIPE